MATTKKINPKKIADLKGANYNPICLQATTHEL